MSTYESLLAQLEKLARRNRQGSFRTKERYYEAVKRFCRFLTVCPGRPANTSCDQPLSAVSLHRESEDPG